MINLKSQIYYKTEIYFLENCLKNSNYLPESKINI